MFKKTGVITLLIVSLICADAFGRGRGGRSGGSRSFSRPSPSRRTNTRPAPRRVPNRSTRPQIKRPTTTNKKQFNTQKRAYDRKASKYNKDKKLYNQAKKNGTAFKDKKSAVAAFKKKNAGKYSSKYASKPATRPSHIPQTTQVGGKTVNITYNQGMGGYGYMGPSGSWVMYNAMADVAMMSILMSRSGYYYGAAPVHPGAAPVYVAPASFAWVWWTMGIIFVLFIGAVIIMAVSSSSRHY